ncbi:MAG: translation elongation factor Ts [Myxococcota bacterium]
MAQISAGDVKALREKTGAGMMDCKKALTDAGGDTEKAMELLRERGLAKAGKRAGRATSEGTIGIAIDGSTAGMVELGCETDFVAKTDAFQALAAEVAAVVAATDGATTPDAALAAKLGDGTVGDKVTATISTVGENIELKRVGRIAVDGGVAGGYVHMGGKLGVIVGLAGSGTDALAKDVAMHVAAHDPTPIAVAREDMPADVVEKERELLKREALQSGKPEKVIDKIVDGRINKFYAENCLLEQGFVKDPDQTVGALVEAAGDGIRVTSFTRFKLGEGGEG